MTYMYDNCNGTLTINSATVARDLYIKSVYCSTFYTNKLHIKLYTNTINAPSYRKKLTFTSFCRDGVAAKNESPIFPNFLTCLAVLLAITGILFRLFYKKCLFSILKLKLSNPAKKNQPKSSPR